MLSERSSDALLLTYSARICSFAEAVPYTRIKVLSLHLPAERTEKYSKLAAAEIPRRYFLNLRVSMCTYTGKVVPALNYLSTTP
jgi:hypothetical protein